MREMHHSECMRRLRPDTQHPITHDPIECRVVYAVYLLHTAQCTVVCTLPEAMHSAHAPVSGGQRSGLQWHAQTYAVPERLLVRRDSLQSD